MPAPENPAPLVVRRVSYDGPAAQQLVARVQQFYVDTYGGPDSSPIEAAHFEGDEGAFLVGLLDGVPVASVAWRRLPALATLPGPRCAEMKRMFLVPEQRGRGLSKLMLDAVERSASDAGNDHLVLETGSLQPVAIQLYRRHGYVDVDGTGWAEYCGHDGVVILGKDLGR